MDRDGPHPTEAGGAEGEAAAIARCRAGDIEGLRTLYELYRRKVFRTCYRLLGDRAAAEDQTQEVFLHVFRKVGTFDGRAAFSSWLYRLAVNHTLNARRRRARQQARLRSLAEDPPAAGRPPAPDEGARRREDRDRLQEALSRLSPEHRAVVVLREVEGLSYRQIAEVLGLPAGTVMSRLHRARRELRQGLEAREPGNRGAPPGVQKGAGEG